MIRACLQCGSSDMDHLTIADGLVAGAGENTGSMVCRICSWRGIPLEFEDADAHAAFAAERARENDSC